MSARLTCLRSAWELKLLGLDTEAKLVELRDCPKRRRVKLGVVGQGGVSRQQLASFEPYGHTFTYHDSKDPGRSTHDTAMVRCILDKLTPLGVQADLHLWHPGEPPAELAADFREAGQQCDVVCLYQSFWGPNYGVITDAIRESPGTLFLSPYVEYKGFRTNKTPQGQACRPWEPATIGHFVTVVPLARKQSKGRILTPSDRDASDSEAINFIAPSYHASGPGGTCPGCEVGTTCAVYLYAVMPEKPSPIQVVDLLRETSAIDRTVLTGVEEFDGDAVDRLQGCVDALLHPAEGKQRKLDTSGVLNLYAAFRKATSEQWH